MNRPLPERNLCETKLLIDNCKPLVDDNGRTITFFGMPILVDANIFYNQLRIESKQGTFIIDNIDE